MVWWASPVLRREDRAVGARRVSREQPHELLHRDLLGIDARQHRHDVPGGSRLHGRADRRVRVLPAAQGARRVGDELRAADEEVV